MGFSEDLVQHLARIPAAPFLFVGSGVSRRYVNAEDWEGLLRKFASSTAQKYERYSSKANGSFPKIASLIAEDFHDHWWDDDSYIEQRESHPSPKGRSSPLKVAISQYLSDATTNLPLQGNLATEIALLKQAKIEGVITTNYDGILEHLFPDFTVFAGQDELLFHDPQGVGEIYKIHGSFTDPESLVLDETDYLKFRQRNVYLAAKLLTIFVEHPVIFIGYSLTDDDVREILTSIAHVLTNENIAKLQDRLIFIQWDESVTEPSLTPMPFAADGMSIPMWNATVPDYSELFTALSKLKRRFPTKVLRQLKEQVYELVKTSEPQGSLYVMDLDADVDVANVEVVIGVGVQGRLADQGITGIERKDLQNDVLTPVLDDQNSDLMKKIVDEVLPRTLLNRTNTPIFRYLRGAGLLTDAGELANGVTIPDAVSKRVEVGLSALRAPGGYIRKALEQVKAANSFADLAANCTVDEVLFAAPHMPIDLVNPSGLRAFLLQSEEHARAGNGLQAVQWGKCVCFYDYITNRTI